jgi:hypothetical protein
MNLGNGVEAEWVPYGDYDKAGLSIRHPTPRGGLLCRGVIQFDLPGVREDLPTPQDLWTVVKWEPLTLEQSLLCHRCGHHGWIRDGQWRPADEPSVRGVVPVSGWPETSTS